MAPAIAAEALRLIGQFFDLERQAQEQKLKAPARLALRQKHSVPILGQPHEKLPY